MKVIKAFFLVVIIYFLMTATNSMIIFVNWASFGKVEIKYLLYLFFALLACIYVLIPLLKYSRKLSLSNLEYFIRENKYERKIKNYIYKTVSDLEYKEFENSNDKKEWIKEYLINKVDSFDQIIMKYAQQVTITVMVSPNSFIDGITILFTNSKMIYDLSKKTGFRYSVKELINMYFSVLAVASFTGIIEEFDGVVEEIIEELAEEFSEIVAEETGKSVSKKIPFLNIAINSLSPILQGAGNYAFMLYSGNRFKYSLLNIIEDEKLTDKEIKRKARKRARASKYAYIKEMSSKIANGTSKKITRSIKQFNPFKKKTEE